MLGDTERPENLRLLGRGIGVRHLLNRLGGHTSNFRGDVERVRLDRFAIRLEAVGRVVNERLIHEAGVDDLTRHGIGHGDVRTDIEAEPGVSELR